MRKFLAVLSLASLPTFAIAAEEKSIVTNSQIQPIPAPDPKEDPLQPAAGEPTVVAECSPVSAVKYTVLGLFRCGERVKNSGLIGVFNRGRACTEEGILAEVYATPNTCDNCESRAAVQSIRLGRRTGNPCENSAYISALVTDLGANARRVRNQAERSLKTCGFRVLEAQACIEQKLPVIVFY